MTNQSKKRKFLATTLTATMVAAAVAPVAGVAAAEKGPFPDVPADHNYAGVITDLVEAGVIEGKTDGNFDLGGKITRAEAAQMVAGLLDLTVGEEDNATDFDDVKGNVWYTGAINSLVEEGIVVGKTDTTFEPNANITRGELAQMLVVAYGLEDVNVDDVELPFTDVDEDIWFAKPIKILFSEGLIKGRTDTTFEPKSDMTRGDFAWLSANIDYVHGDKLQKPEVEAPEVESVKAINATTLSVTLSDDSVYEVTLEEALEEGVETEVTFTINDVEYTVTVTWDGEEEVVVELTVESVTAITTTNVDVSFSALEGDLEDVTVEVKNSKGEVVETKSVNIREGDTIASFDFETAVSESDLTGIWTVDGVEYNFVDKELAEKILEAAAGSSDVLLLEALTNADIENVNEELAPGYKNAINEADPEPTTLAEIQEIVNVENEKYGKVKAVIDGNIALLGNEVKVYNALKAGFENVESRWSQEYRDANIKLADGAIIKISELGPSNYTGVKAISYDELQAALDRVVFYETNELVEALYDDEPTAEKISTAKGLVSKYAKLAYQVEDEVTAGDYLEDRLTQLELLVNVDKATTKAGVKSALTKLGDFDASLVKKYDGVTTVSIIEPDNAVLTTTTISVAADFTVEEYTLKANVDDGFGINDANLDAYVKGFKQAAWAAKDSVQGIVTIVKDVNNAEAVTLIDTLAEEATAYGSDAEKRPAFLKALQAVGAKRVVSNNLEVYADKSNGIVAAFAGLNTDSGSDLKDVQKIVDAANIFVVSNLSSNNEATKLVNALKALEIKDLTVDAANKDYYLTEIKALNLGAFDSTSVDTDTNAIETAVKKANKDATIAAALKGFNEATTAADAKTALDDLSAVTELNAYASIPAGDKEYIADELLKSRDVLTSDRNLLGTDVGGITTLPKAEEFRTVGELVHYLTQDVNETTANIDFNGDGTVADSGNGFTLKNPINKRTALIAGVNGITTNQPGTASTSSYALDVTDASVDNTMTYKTSDVGIATVDASTGAVTFGTGTDGQTVDITVEVNGVVVDTQTLTVNTAEDDFNETYAVFTNNAVSYASDNVNISVDGNGTATITGTVADNDTADITATVAGTVVKTTTVTVSETVTTDPVAYEQFLLNTATTFKNLGVAGFSKKNDPVSSSDIALVEKYFNSAAFYKLSETGTATDNGKAVGDLKQSYTTVAQFLEFLK